MTPAQLRAARGLLGWPRKALSTASGVSVETLKNIESGKFIPQVVTVRKLIDTLAENGVELIGSRYVQGVVMVLEDRVSIAERMTTAVVEIMREQGGCVPQDLLEKGFTEEEIDCHWPMAKALAHVELDISDS